MTRAVICVSRLKISIERKELAVIQQILILLMQTGTNFEQLLDGQLTFCWHLCHASISNHTWSIGEKRLEG